MPKAVCTATCTRTTCTRTGTGRVASRRGPGSKEGTLPHSGVPYLTLA